MRHYPQQQRGQRRVEQILNAAAEVFGEIGFETATTNAIAQRAQTSIGSLYQFFPNKEAIVDALSDRYAAELVARLTDHEQLQLGCYDLLEQSLDTIAAYYMANPGFRALFFGAFAYGFSMQIELRLYTPVTDAFMRIVSTFSEHFSPAEQQVHAEIVVRALGRLLFHYSCQPSTHQPKFLQEMKRLLGGYLCDAAHKTGTASL